MGTFAKIFIVVNLVLAVVVLGAVGTLLGTSEDWKGKYETKTAELEDIIAKKDAKITKLNQDLSTLRTEKNQLTQKTIDQAAQIAQQTQEWVVLKEKFNAQVASLQEQTKLLKDLEQNVEDARTRNQTLQGKLDTALEEKRAADRTADDLRNDLEREKLAKQAALDDLAQANKENKNLSEDNDRKARTLAMVAKRGGLKFLEGLEPTEAVDGVVTGVDEPLNIVLISVGSDDKVEIGYTLTVYRGGAYLGKLLIDKVGPDWASGHMDPNETKEFPKRGDRVSTQL
jgi:hypothetical protein